MKPHFQTKTTTASANKRDIAITLYPTNTQRGYDNDENKICSLYKNTSKQVLILLSPTEK